jgi:hypothetical protein
VIKLLDIFQMKKFTLSFRESVHIEREQLNMLQSMIKANDLPPTLNDYYAFDYSKPTTRWALAEVAKTVQHIANISCLPNEEMLVRLIVSYCLFFSSLVCRLSLVIP